MVWVILHYTPSRALPTRENCSLASWLGRRRRQALLEFNGPCLRKQAAEPGELKEAAACSLVSHGPAKAGFSPSAGLAGGRKRASRAGLRRRPVGQTGPAI